MSQSSTPGGGTAQSLPDRSWMPTMAGVLDLCAGASSLIGSAVLAFLAVAARAVPIGVSEPEARWPFDMGFVMFFGLSMLLLVLGLLAVIGGFYALRGARGLWPIFGAIAATLSCFPLGIAAIVLTVMGEQDPGSAGTADRRQQRASD